MHKYKNYFSIFCYFLSSLFFSFPLSLLWVSNLLWIWFLIFCFVIILSIAILICPNKRLFLLQMLHILKNKQNTDFYFKKFLQVFAFICMGFFEITFFKFFVHFYFHIKLTETSKTLLNQQLHTHSIFKIICTEKAPFLIRISDNFISCIITYYKIQRYPFFSQNTNYFFVIFL